MRRLPGFHLLRAFEAAARLGGLALAARELNVTPSAVSHQVRDLEAALGCALFLRTGRRVVLTAPGRRLLARLTPLLDGLQEACAELSAPPGHGQLALHCAPSFAVKWLGPRLAPFLDRHPGLAMRLSTGVEAGAVLERGEADAAIVYGEPLRGPGIACEGLGRERIAPLCAPALAARIGNLADALPQTPLIESPLSPVKWADWCAWNGIAVALAPRLSMDRAALAIAAAVDGLGVALESTRLAERELARGELVELPAPAAPLERTVHHLCYRMADRGHPHIEALRAWLLAGGEGHAEPGAPGSGRRQPG